MIIAGEASGDAHAASLVRALLGPGAKVLINRGKFLPSDWGAKVLVTVHPSSILRVPPEDRWAIASYIRAIQLSQHAAPADADANAAKQLEETKP